jgi:hypothetical protein
MFTYVAVALCTVYSARLARAAACTAANRCAALFATLGDDGDGFRGPFLTLALGLS